MNTDNMAQSFNCGDFTQTEIQMQTSMKQTHEATCNKCQSYPILGIRYKCSVCRNYDLCPSCESKTDHPHPFIQLKRADQAPADRMIDKAVGVSEYPAKCEVELSLL